MKKWVICIDGGVWQAEIVLGSVDPVRVDFGGECCRARGRSVVRSLGRMVARSDGAAGAPWTWSASEAVRQKYTVAV